MLHDQKHELDSKFEQMFSYFQQIHQESFEVSKKQKIYGDTSFAQHKTPPPPQMKLSLKNLTFDIGGNSRLRDSGCFLNAFEQNQLNTRMGDGTSPMPIKTNDISVKLASNDLNDDQI